LGDSASEAVFRVQFERKKATNLALEIVKEAANAGSARCRALGALDEEDYAYKEVRDTSLVVECANKVFGAWTEAEIAKKKLNMALTKMKQARRSANAALQAAEASGMDTTEMRMKLSDRQELKLALSVARGMCKECTDLNRQVAEAAMIVAKLQAALATEEQLTRERLSVITEMSTFLAGFLLFGVTYGYVRQSRDAQLPAELLLEREAIAIMLQLIAFGFFVTIIFVAAILAWSRPRLTDLHLPLGLFLVATGCLFGSIYLAAAVQFEDQGHDEYYWTGFALSLAAAAIIPLVLLYCKVTSKTHEKGFWKRCKIFLHGTAYENNLIAFRHELERKRNAYDALEQSENATEQGSSQQSENATEQGSSHTNPEQPTGQGA
jgi:hypothetical protein